LGRDYRGQGAAPTMLKNLWTTTYVKSRNCCRNVAGIARSYQIILLNCLALNDLCPAQHCRYTLYGQITVCPHR
ncbi:MAG: hypothetical protein ACXWT1_19360, partial [Methylobacter sp.]